MQTENQRALRRLSLRPFGALLFVSVAALVTGCRADGNTPPLYTEAPPAQSAVETPEQQAPEESTDGRALWFRGGDGRAAILARERNDHEGAVALLDRLLTREELSARDRAAALWLRGLEDLREDQFERAAERFAAARRDPSMAAVEGRLRVLEAQARLDAGDPAAALELVRELPNEGALASTILIIQADALQRTNQEDEALARYAEFLRRFSADARRHEVRVKQARLYLRHRPDDPEAQRQALELYERLMLDVPLSDYAAEAAERAPELRAKLPQPRSRAQASEAERRVALATIESELKRGRYASTITDVDAFLKRGGLAAGEKCEALYLKASAVFKQRKRAKARPVYDLAARQCKKAGEEHVTTLVKSRYQSARGRYAEGAYSKAARAFEALARDFADHSYADDGLVLAGESWAEAGDHARERKAYERSIAEHPDGDMAQEARRRLIVLAFTDGRHEDVLSLTDDPARAGATGVDLGKLLYFRGRALQKLDRASEAEDAWVAASEAAPLSYVSVQALSRLREVGEAALARGVAVLEGAGEGAAPVASLALPEGDAAARAQLLASLGLGEEAAEELQEGGVGGWPAAAVLAQAGQWSASQRALGRVGASWREAAPVANRELWALAHPKAFGELVDVGEREHGLPKLLTYAIMQTESRFDPGATSWAGARGLVQLMPATAKGAANKLGLEGFDPQRLYEPAFNLSIGQYHLAQLVRRFGGDDAAVPLAIPSYNAGAGAVQRWLKERGALDFDLFIETIPFDETRKYTQSVLGRWMAYRWTHGGEEQASRRIPYVPLALPTAATSRQDDDDDDAK
ncbi:MAG: transglycosylase SLT domain-containing protein [Myxococcales bacterium]|nr:transglycosylase SLT domain-containing protein [Myxococcales bacterium]